MIRHTLRWAPRHIPVIGLQTTIVFSSLTSRSPCGMVLPARSLRLCSFRGRSRHTCGFEPLGKFDLPQQEFLAAAGVDRERDRICFQRTPGSEVFQWVQSNLSDEEMADAASRCVLVHGLFEVWGHGRNTEEAAADAARSRRIPQHCVEASWSLAVTSFGRSQLTREEENSLLEGPVSELLSTELKGCRTEALVSDIHIHVIEDTCPPPPVPFFGARGYRRRRKGSSRDVGGIEPDNGKLIPRESHCYICRLIQGGPATGGRSVLGMTSRRPKTGILNDLALRSRKSKGPTAIEPEVALIMANLGKVRSGSRVLDPFCGYCSLLLPAASMGAKTWGTDIVGPVVAASALARGSGGASPATPSVRGVEKVPQDNDTHALQGSNNTDMDSLAAIYDDFAMWNLLKPELTKADITDETSSVRRPGFFDAIITDPPYNIKERIHINHDDQDNTTHMFVPLVAEEVGYLSSSAALHYEEARVLSEEDRLRSTGSIDGGDAGKSTWDGRGSTVAVERANGLVRAVILALLSLARYALKPGGRLVFFLPLRGEEARLDSLPPSIMEKICEKSTVEEQLSLVYATKQRLTSQNMCRWLIALEKTCERGERDGESHEDHGQKK